MPWGHDKEDGQDEEAFHILDTCDGCVPEDCIGDDVLADIREKFYCVFWAVFSIAQDTVHCAEFDLLIDRHAGKGDSNGQGKTQY